MNNSITFLKQPGHTVVLIDDSETNLGMLEEVVRRSLPKPNVVRYTNPKQALSYIISNPNISLVITDYSMPILDGDKVIAKIRSSIHNFNLPILVITAHDDPDFLPRSYKAGTTDFVRRPFDPKELMHKISNLVLARQFSSPSSTISNDVLFEQAAAVDLIARLASIHRRFDRTSMNRMISVGHALVNINGGTSEDKHRVASVLGLCDIGCVALPECMQHHGPKSSLSIANEELIRSHVHIGYRLLKDSNHVFYRSIADFVLHHHETWDGSGYPSGLQGTDIPFESRIARIVLDFREYLTSNYNGSGPIDRAVMLSYDKISEGEGVYYDPTLVIQLSMLAHDSDFLSSLENS